MLFFAVAGCLAAAPGLTQTADPPPNVVELTGVSYGVGVRYKANIDYPVAITPPTTEPVIILMHGGAPGGAEDLVSGSRFDTYIEQRAWDLAGWGFVVVNIDYPAAHADGSVNAIEQLGALQLAIRWVRATGLTAYLPFGLSHDSTGIIEVGVEGWGAGGTWAMDNLAYGAIWPGTVHSRIHPNAPVTAAMTISVGGWYNWLTMPPIGPGSQLTQAYFASVQSGIGPVPSSCPSPSGPTDSGWCWTAQYLIGNAPNQYWGLASGSADQVISFSKQYSIFFNYLSSVNPCSSCAGYFNIGGHGFCNENSDDFTTSMDVLNLFFQVNFNNGQSPIWGPGFTPVSGYRGMAYSAPAACN
jgi:hypothetical protein